MGSLRARYHEAKQQAIIREAAESELALQEVATLNRLDIDELKSHVALYHAHGERIFAPAERELMELELFKLMYPDGAPKLTMRQALKQTLREHAKEFRVALALPFIMAGLAWLSTWAFGADRDESVTISLACGGTFFVWSLLCVLILTSWETSARAAKGKLREVTYLRERRKIANKQEVTGALQLAVDGEELQGSLELSQDAGSLSIADDDSRR